MHLVIRTPGRSYLWEVDDESAIDTARAAVGFPTSDSADDVVGGYRVELHQGPLHKDLLAQLEPGPDLAGVSAAKVNAHKKARADAHRTRRVKELKAALAELDDDERAEVLAP